MIDYVKYRKSDGIIVGAGKSRKDLLEKNDRTEDFDIIYTMSYNPLLHNKVVNGQLVEKSDSDKIKDKLLQIRLRRNQLLASSDWTMLEDCDLSNADKTLWKNYRKELRNFPATCDVNNPIWPVPPGVIV